MADCIFCKIVKGEIPCHKVYEDEDFFAFLDIRPLNLGHTLIVPKKHFRWVWDVPNIDRYYQTVGKIANAMKKAFNTDYVVSMVFGQEVAHAHVWLVPRFENDGHGGAIKLENIKTLSDEEMRKAAEKLQMVLKGLK